jgi:transcription termination factor NusB
VVIINEYVSIIASFGDGKNAGFVNGILEKIAGETGAVAAREAQV